MILLDTSGLLALLDGDQPQHEAAASVMSEARPPFLLSPLILAEVDYMLARHVSEAAQLAFLREVEIGAYQLEPFGRSDIRRARELMIRYGDLAIGLADASLVVLAERHGTRDLLTLVERHFRVVVGAGGRPFRLLPADF